MVSRRLVEEIQRNAPKLSADLIHAIRRDQRTEAYHALAHEKLRELVEDLYARLEEWLQSRSEFALEKRYVTVGRERFSGGIPLSQVIYALTLTKTKLLNFVHGAMTGDASERDLELQLVFSISQFFDQAVYFIGIGYEDACKAAASSLLEEEKREKKSKLRRLVVSPVAEQGEELDLPISRAGDIGESSG